MAAAAAMLAAIVSVLLPVTFFANALELELENVVITQTETGDIEIIPKDLFELCGIDAGAGTLTINLNSLKETVTSFAGGSLSGRTVILAAPSKDSAKLNKNLSLAHISFEDDLVTCVGEDFASNCSNLMTVSFGSKINTIGKNAFSNCKSLQGTAGTTLDLSNVEKIGEGAFSGNSEFTNVKFGENLDYVGNSAFSGDVALKSLNFHDGLCSIGDYAFKGCSGLESVRFNGNDLLEYIGASAFENCTSLTAVNVRGFVFNRLPNGSGSIVCGANVFKGCTSLQNFTWSCNFTSIPSGTFYGCSALNRFTFEGGSRGSVCEIIDSTAFADCSSLVSIELPDANTRIGNSAFLNCTKLAQVVVSDNLTEVGEGAFSSCRALSLYPVSDADKTKNKAVLPATWTVISDSTFANCSGLTQVNIMSATSIGEYAFDGCSSLTDVTIPDAVTTLFDCTFRNCESLKDVVVSRNLSVLGKSKKSTDPLGCVFQNCTSLETLTPSNKEKLPYTLQFPASLGGVHAHGFENCPSFRYINFGQNSQFSVLGEYAFSKCTGLQGSNEGGNASTTLVIPSGVHDIFKSVFSGCTSLVRIEFIGNLSTIGISAFQNCTSLEEIIMNDTIKQVRSSAFADCTSLKQMPHTKEGSTALSNVDTIHSDTFKNCTSLEEAFIPRDISLVATGAFACCTALKTISVDENNAYYYSSDGVLINKERSSLALYPAGKSGESYTVPSSVKIIEAGAFYGNTKLISITITPSVDTIGKQAFYETENLKALYFTGKKELWNKVTTGDSWSALSGLGDLPSAKQITFQVTNGKWNDGTTEDKVITVVGNNANRLNETFIPAVGKEPDVHYLEGGWNNVPLKTDLTGDSVFVYAYSNAEYEITWKDDNGQIIDVTTVEYGKMPQHVPLDKKADSQFEYTFTGWSPAVTAVTGPAEYKATLKAVEHVFDRELVDEKYLKSKADCTNAAVYWKSCECGEKGIVTFESGEPLGHDYKTLDGTAVAPNCTQPGKEADKKCSRCDSVITGKEIAATGHKFDTESVDEKYLKDAADCTHSAVYYKSCTICGEKGTETFESGEPLGHQWIAATGYSPKTCERCGITEGDVIRYIPVGGDTVVWKKGDGAIIITINRSEQDEMCFANYRETQIDKKAVAVDAKAGSTVVTVGEETLKTLRKGEHTITIVFADGTVELKLTVDEPTTPDTGDSLTVVLPVSVMLLALVVATGTAVYRKKNGTD